MFSPRKNNAWMLFFFCLFFPFQSKAGSFDFFKEKIIFRVGKEECRVIGYYYFKSNAPDSSVLNLIYPVSKNFHLPFPHFFKVTTCDNDEPVPYRIYENGILFQIHMPPYGFRTCSVEYHQKTPRNTMEYILTSTSRWKQPLQSADFIIEIPDDINLKTISLPQNGCQKEAEKTIYRINRQEFMPDSNLIIKWGIKE